MRHAARVTFVVLVLALSFHSRAAALAVKNASLASRVEAFFMAYPSGHVDSGARPTRDELNLLKLHLSHRLHKVVMDAVAYRHRWIQEHPDEPRSNGSPPVVFKPPFAEGFDFAGSPDGVRRFAIERTVAANEIRWHVHVRFWYDAEYSWQTVIVVTREHGKYVIDDVIFSDDDGDGKRSRLSDTLLERWK
jgi:hypothetical protein